MALHRLTFPRLQLAGAALLATGLLLAAAHPAAAMSMKDCGASYKAAKAAGTLNGATWKTYRATQCSSTAAAPTATPAAATTAVTAPSTAATAATAAKPATAPAVPAPAMAPAAGKTAAVPAPVATGNAVFPDKVDPKYGALKAGKARMKTCDDQYKANKAANANGGMKWLEKGGGYYSACSKHLKGA